MWDEFPKSRHWAFPLMASIIILALVIAYAPVMTEWLVFAGWGLVAVFTAWAVVNLVHQVVVICGEEYSQVLAARYKMSANALAEQIRGMDKWQLQTLRMFGSQVIQIMMNESESEPPVEIIYGTQVSLAFAEYFLSRSDERSCCPIKHFTDQTYHWDWTGENRIQDRDQAREFTAWLVRMGMARWWNGNQAAAWEEDSRGRRWSPDKVLKRLGFEVDGGEQ